MYEKDFDDLNLLSRNVSVIFLIGWLQTKEYDVFTYKLLPYNIFYNSLENTHVIL